MQPFPKKEDAPNFSNEAVQKAFVEEATNSRTLLQKELEINKQEQVLLTKRVQMMKQFANELPTSDPQYSMLLAQIKMDQLELNELKTREMLLSQKITE